MSEVTTMLKSLTNPPNYINEDSIRKSKDECLRCIELFRQKNINVKKVYFYSTPLVLRPSLMNLAIGLGIFHQNLYIETDNEEHPGFYLARGNHRHIMFFELKDRETIDNGTAYEIGFDPTEQIKAFGTFSHLMNTFNVNIPARGFTDFVEKQFQQPYRLIMNNCTHFPIQFLQRFPPNSQPNFLENHAVFVQQTGKRLLNRLYDLDEFFEEMTDFQAMHFAQMNLFE